MRYLIIVLGLFVFSPAAAFCSGSAEGRWRFYGVSPSEGTTTCTVRIKGNGDVRNEKIFVDGKRVVILETACSSNLFPVNPVKDGQISTSNPLYDSSALNRCWIKGKIQIYGGNTINITEGFIEKGNSSITGTARINGIQSAFTMTKY